MTRAPDRYRQVLEYLPHFRVASLKLFRDYPPLHDFANGFVISGSIAPFRLAGVEPVARMLDWRVPIFLDPVGAIGSYSELLPLKTMLPSLDSIDPNREYKVELWDRADGSMPEFVMRDPPFRPDDGHPHRGGFLLQLPRERPVLSSCYVTHDLTAWNPDADELIDPLTWGASWVAAHAIWEQTGVWLSPVVETDVLTQWWLDRNRRCACGSTRAMKDCHTPRDLAATRARREQQSRIALRLELDAIRLWRSA